MLKSTAVERGLLGSMLKNMNHFVLWDLDICLQRKKKIKIVVLSRFLIAQSDPLKTRLFR